MADTVTTNLALVQPEVGASTDTWGDKINTDLGILDALFSAGPVLMVSKGGTGAATAAAARSNLGLLGMSVQAPNSVGISGGTIAGLTSLDSSPIGQTTPAAGKFTALQFTGVMTFPDGTTQITAASGFTAGVQSVSASTTLVLSYQDHVIKADASTGAITLLLFTASGNTGRRIAIKKMDSSVNTITIDGASTETIDGALTQTIYRQYDAITLVSDGTGWLIT